MPRVVETSSKMPDTEVATNLFGFEWVRVQSTQEDGLPYDVIATVVPRNGRYVVSRLEVVQSSSGPPIQRGELGKVSMEPFVDAAAARVLQGVGPDKWRPITPTPMFFDRIMSGERLSDEDLPQLAALYRWIKLQGGNPTASMANQFEVSTATVKRWLVRAVNAGHLTRAERLP